MTLHNHLNSADHLRNRAESLIQSARTQSVEVKSRTGKVIRHAQKPTQRIQRPHLDVNAFIGEISGWGMA